ncbi:MAG: hypothetical protein R3293_12490 [Candidatus Promineifilaceae bacterium]|nr:hypothetical protein [Candidatus Promineifilaceae bacterium]
MKTRLPVMVQDPNTSRFKNIKFVEDSFAEGESYFLDGPVSERVAILDFDEQSGELRPGVVFSPPGRVLAHYEITCLPNSKKYDTSARDFHMVCVLGSILKTMYIFEREEVLGRRLEWAFDAPHLLVIPRAGLWENAFYERETHSLQFFYFPSKKDKKQIIYTSLSRDIVAHETAHAIVDGIVPDLYDALTPQSLALHEAVADLTAVLMSFRSHNLVRAILRETEGSIMESTAFSSIAEEFGSARDPLGEAQDLRSLYNDKKLSDVSSFRPHGLSEVLSGALYTLMVKLHEYLKQRYAQEPEFANKRRPAYAAAYKALGVGRTRFSGMILRALDYLPPGDVSFADYGRAIIAADKGLLPEGELERDWLKEEFVKRGIVAHASELDVKMNYIYEPLAAIDADDLVESDWVAYQFAHQNRELLRIPEDVSFKVSPRHVATKYAILRRPGQEDIARKVYECLFKVSWQHTEANHVSATLPDKRRINVGTTLVIDFSAPGNPVRALLTSDLSEQQRENRDALLRHLLDEGLLKMGPAAVGPHGRPLASVVQAESTNGYLHINGTARMLHIVGD